MTYPPKWEKFDCTFSNVTIDKGWARLLAFLDSDPDGKIIKDQYIGLRVTAASPYLLSRPGPNILALLIQDATLVKCDQLALHLYLIG